ncbi:tryptophan synthase subunit alpha [Iamia majanohamensis]|uniref:Tryptophan synthase alpha chain n=1 Tax=Iamia majanohamensis TaxID=467976 RepID=A0AAE9YDX6_9ACTN|nr:tryptophan synthase subunit alpha [Iamia majanohamensis]WCO69044.1 tryptophan synthase subunit alpha [Iamia majanohamensis]
MKAPDGFLEAHLRARRDGGAKLLVPYITGGIDPRWVDLVRSAADAGADAIEIGIPFSDPVMDGPTIQAASERALEHGATPASILDDLAEADVDVPLAVMTYFNIVFHAGVERFASEARAAGISGVILPDVPLEEMGEWDPAAAAAGLETVMLVSPLTPEDRVPRLTGRAQGFVYGVNLLGVTGERASIGSMAADLAGRLKAVTDVPTVMGFGVSTPAQAAEVASHADGVVVGSALMRRVLDGEGPLRVGQAISELRAALDGG